MITFADAPLIEAILAVALAAILRPRPAEGREISPAEGREISPEGGLKPEPDYLPAVARTLRIIGVAPVEALKGVSIDAENRTLFDLGAILPPGLRPAYYEAKIESFRRPLDVGPLMAELMGPIADGAGRGEPAMTLLLAHIHRYGLGVPEDFDEAFRLTRQAAEAGDLVAASILGDMLIHGLGTLPDFGEAVVWLRRALPLGATKTRRGLWLARVYRPDLVSQAEAVESVKFAASRGDALARFITDDGLAGPSFTIDDLRLDARDGDPELLFILGQRLLFGPPGDRDEAEGLAAIHQAARGRDDRAARLLARLYRDGARGSPRDASEADKWASAAERFADERVGLIPRPGAPGSTGPVTRSDKAGLAGQTGKRNKPRKPKKAKKPRSRG